MPNIVEYFKHQIANEYDIQAFLVGDRGAGKSCAGVRLGELLDPSFDIDRVCYTTKQVLHKVKELHETIGTEGKVIVYDEAGVGVGNRDWQKESNKLMNYFIQQSRVFGLIMIYTTPNLSFVDKQARTMGGVMLEFRKSYGKGVCRPYKVTADNFTGDLRTPRFIMGNDLMAEQHFKLPSRKLFRAYIKKSRDTKSKSFDFEKMNYDRLTPKQKNIWDKTKQGISQYALADELKVNQSYISVSLKAIRNKLEVSA